MQPPTILKPEEEKFIAENLQQKTVIEIAKDLKRSITTIYAYYKANGLTPARSNYKPDRNHPFKRKNRELEAVFIQRKIENRKYNPR
jgi:hypothetical protein